MSKAVEENKHRSNKIFTEKKVLEMQTSKKGDGNISDAAYQKLTKQISEIRDNCDKKRARGQNVPDPSLQLVEIETHVNKILKFIKMAKQADELGGTNYVSKIIVGIKENFKSIKRD